MADDDKKLKTGRLSRLAKLASMSAKLSTDVVSRGVKRIAGRPEVESIFGAGTAEKLVETLGELKGLAMKMGQQMAMDPDLLTPEIRAVVARLQNQAPPMPFSVVTEVVSRELGKAPLEAYASFEEQPMASASLGQVHRARTHEGRVVAVKVQYPDIGRALSSDLENVGTMVNLVSASTRITHGKEYFAELRDSLLDELDYRREAERAREFAAAAARLPQLKIPTCDPALTSERVLTMELIEGPTLKELLSKVDTLDAAERFRLSRLLMFAIWGPFMASGVVHSDPHPGNFIFMADGRIAVLDFGAIKQLSDRFRDTNRRLFRLVVAGAPFDVIQLSEESGFQFDDPVDARPFVEKILEIATRPPRTRSFDFAQAGISRDMRNLFIKNGIKLAKIRPPKESVQYFKAVGGLSQNLENLGASGDFKAVYEEMLSLAPSAPEPDPR